MRVLLYLFFPIFFIEAGIKVNWKYIIVALKLGLSIALLYFLVNKISYTEIALSFKQIDLLFLFAAVGTGVFNFYIQFRSWRYLLRNINTKANDKEVLGSLLSGYTFGLLTPSRIGEAPGRAFSVDKNRIVKNSLAVFYEKLIGLMVMLIFGAISLAAFTHLNQSFQPEYSLFIIWGASGFGILCIITAFLPHSFIIKFVVILKRFSRLQKYIIKIERAIGLADKTRHTLLLYSTIKYFGFIVEFTLLVIGFSGSLEFANIFLAINAVYFAKLFVSYLSFADLGIREAAAVYFLGYVGIAEAAALNSAFIIFLINILLPSVIGIFFILKRKNE